MLTSQQSALMEAARTAHLSTADAHGAPHLIPICFVYHEGRFYSAIDRKPKSTSSRNLKRVKNILANPKVALVIDHYEEDWRRLWYILVTGTASLIEDGDDHQNAISKLRGKYDQYQDMDIDQRLVIGIEPTKINCWGEIFKHE